MTAEQGTVAIEVTEETFYKRMLQIIIIKIVKQTWQVSNGDHF